MRAAGAAVCASAENEHRRQTSGNYARAIVRLYTKPVALTPAVFPAGATNGT